MLSISRTREPLFGTPFTTHEITSSSPDAVRTYPDNAET